MKNVICMAFDGWHAYGLRAVRTIRKAGYTGDVHVLDLGIPDDQLTELRTLCTVSPMPDSVKNWDGAPNHNRAMTCRPHLRELVPGYELYMWMDADIRIVDASAIHDYFRMAEPVENGYPIAIHQEADPAYGVVVIPQVSQSYHRGNRERHAHALLQFLDDWCQLNGGIWAAHRDSQMWMIYGATLEASFKLPYDRMREQDALNAAATYNGQVQLMSANDNYILPMAISPPNVDAKGNFIHPIWNKPIRVLHLAAAGAKNVSGDLLADVYTKNGLDLGDPSE